RMFFSSSTISSRAIVGSRGQVDGEFTAAGGTLDENPPAVAFDNILDDRQAQPAAARLQSVGPPLRETLEQMVADLGCDARTAVADLDADEILARLDADRDGAAAGRVAQRVADQVRYHPGQLYRVAGDR